MGSTHPKETCNAYSQYGGQSVSAAGLKGAAQGLSGLVGLGGAWKPVSENALNNITSDFDTLKAKLQKWEQVYEGKLTQAQENFQQTQLQFMQDIQDFQDEMLDEKITKNSLVIAIIFSALIVIIIYLAIL